jgi:hypothetical protein
MKLKINRNLIMGLLAAGVFTSTFAADYTTMTTEEMVNMRSQVRSMSSEEREGFRNEMRTRMKSMSAEERSQFQQMRGQGQGGGMGQGGGRGFGSR